MKCEICKVNINKTFLDKIIGTHMRDSKGKKHLICFECQKEYSKKTSELKEILG